jgi:hypothetical protein
VQKDGQFNVVWKTKGSIRAQPWARYIEGNEKKKDEPDKADARAPGAGNGVTVAQRGRRLSIVGCRRVVSSSTMIRSMPFL